MFGTPAWPHVEHGNARTCGYVVNGHARNGHARNGRHGRWKKLILQEWSTIFHLRIKQRPYSSSFWGTKSFVSPDRTTYKMFIKEVALVHPIRPERRGVLLGPHQVGTLVTLKVLSNERNCPKNYLAKIWHVPRFPRLPRNQTLIQKNWTIELNRTLNFRTLDFCQSVWRLSYFGIIRVFRNGTHLGDNGFRYVLVCKL